jgi:molybdopterin synthase sulfur carrier subunit
MAIKVRIPTPLQTYTHGREEVEVLSGRSSGQLTVSELIGNLDRIYPGIGEKITEQGKIRGYINIYVMEKDIRFLQGEQTPVKDGDEITIIPAIAGGSSMHFLRNSKEGL